MKWLDLSAQRVGPFVKKEQKAPTQLLGVFQRGATALWSATEAVYLTSRSPSGPFNVYVPDLQRVLPRLSPGEEIRMENQRILIGGANLGIDLAQAESWPVLSIPALASREVVQAHAWSLLNQVYAIYSTQSSLFRILAELLLNFDHPAGIALRDAFNYSACLAKMLAGLGRGDLQLLTEGSLAFIGRGPGMTPSGDDFLAGLLAVDYQIRMDTGDQDPVWKHLVESVLAERQKRTHPLSAVLIWAAAQGSVDEALEGVIASLLAGREVRPDQVHQLAEVGHSSGLDGLAGALFRLLASPKVPNF